MGKPKPIKMQETQIALSQLETTLQFRVPRLLTQLEEMQRKVTAEGNNPYRSRVLSDAIAALHRLEANYAEPSLEAVPCEVVVTLQYHFPRPDWSVEDIRSGLEMSVWDRASEAGIGIVQSVHVKVPDSHGPEGGVAVEDNLYGYVVAYIDCTAGKFHVYGLFSTLKAAEELRDKAQDEYGRYSVFPVLDYVQPPPTPATTDPLDPRLLPESGRPQ